MSQPPEDLSDSEYLPDPSTLLQTTTAKPLKQSTLPFGQTPSSIYLPELNEAQRKAVTASREGGLAVHAGPGSGKTKVLTTRVAWLIQEAGVKPEELVVVTFTNKAANEMKVRLAKIVGAATVDKVVMGTFHSVCVRFLRKHGNLIGLPSNFLITDRDDCLAIIKRILLSDFIPPALKREMKPPSWLEVISKCKATLKSPDQYRAERMGEGAVTPEKKEKVEAIARVYQAYEDELAKANALDFDDLLLRGHKLFKRHPRIVAKIQSVLIDEFQDTNTVQYDLVKMIAGASGSLTIVGDPDQSIYGWRNAEIENLEKMLDDFKPVKQIFLEQNYRSTGAILGAALAVVKQDEKRIQKSLVASHPSGSSVVLHHAPTAVEEATFIASSIKHLVAHLGGLVTYNDFAVLLRYGALSRAIESAFQRSGIPSRMVGGHKFFERSEIKDLLSYLQLIHNPSYTPALLRVINVPRRGIGDKTLKELTAAAERKKISAFEVCVRLANGADGLGLVKGLGGGQRKAIKGLVECVRDARRMADNGADVADLIDYVCEKVQYEQYLERTHSSDHAERWENVKELKTYATIVAEENPAVELATAADATDEAGESQFEEVAIPVSVGAGGGGGGKEEESDDEIEVIDPIGEDDEDDEKIEVPMASQAAAEGRTTPLEVFLATSMLATDTDTQDAKNDKNADKVTLSTCHAAKGLEWPIVFVPSCENGTYPFFRCETESEIDEERRLLYVAITRAQGFCFLSYAQTRMAGADAKTKELSSFLAKVSTTYPTLFVKKLQKISQKTREETAAVLGRQAPDEEDVKLNIDEYTATQPVEPVIFDPKVHASTTSRNYSSFGGRYGGGGGGFSRPFSSQQSQGKYGASSGFTTAAGTSTGRWSNVPLAQSQPQAVPPGEGGFRSALSTFRPAGSAPSASQPPPLKLSNPYAAAAAAAAAKPNAWRAGARYLAVAASSSSSSFDINDPSSSAPVASTTTSALPPPPKAKAKLPGFRPPTMMNPQVGAGSSTLSSAATAHPVLPAFVPPAPLPSSAPTNDGEAPLITETRASRIGNGGPGVLVNPKLSKPGPRPPSNSGELLASFEKGAKGELDAFKLFGKKGEGELSGKEVEEISLISSQVSVEDMLPLGALDEDDKDDLPHPSKVVAPLPPEKKSTAKAKAKAAPLPPQSPKKTASGRPKRAAKLSQKIQDGGGVAKKARTKK